MHQETYTYVVDNYKNCLGDAVLIIIHMYSVSKEDKKSNYFTIYHTGPCWDPHTG